MTRDEAIRKLLKFNSLEWSTKWVNAFVELGILNLDEPKRPAFQELCYRLAGDFGWSHSTGKMKEIELALEAAGLKIVEA